MPAELHVAFYFTGMVVWALIGFGVVGFVAWQLFQRFMEMIDNGDGG